DYCCMIWHNNAYWVF
nr:immunoglobulin light chain junction region [Macaca mulatta]MOY06624.1 immunoglobulin light chain junction region [Macaca mulatta]